MTVHIEYILRLSHNQSTHEHTHACDECYIIGVYMLLRLKDIF